MATAEQLLNEAQFEFHRISVGNSSNGRHAARAKSLCRKIFRKYPGTSEAAVAHGIMMRLGEDTPVPREVREFQQAHESHQPATVGEVIRKATREESLPEAFRDQPLDWGGLLSLLPRASKSVLVFFTVAGLIIFGFLGPLAIVLLSIPVLMFTVPVRRMMPEKKRLPIDVFVAAINGWMADQRGNI